MEDFALQLCPNLEEGATRRLLPDAGGGRAPPSERGDVGGADRGEYCGVPSHVHGATTRTVRGAGPTARTEGSYMPLAVTEGRVKSPGETARMA